MPVVPVVVAHCSWHVQTVGFAEALYNQSFAVVVVVVAVVVVVVVVVVAMVAVFSADQGTSSLYSLYWLSLESSYFAAEAYTAAADLAEEVVR